MDATQIENGLWVVNAPDAAPIRVFTKLGATRADALAVYDEAVNGPATEEIDQAFRVSLVKAECRRRILAVANYHSQINVIGEMAAGTLTPQKEAKYRKAVSWVRAMRAQCKALSANGQDYTDDANWPAVPQDVKDLMVEF